MSPSRIGAPLDLSYLLAVGTEYPFSTSQTQCFVDKCVLCYRVQTKKLILKGFTGELHRITKVQKNLFFVVCMEVKSRNLKHNLLPELLTSLYWKLFDLLHLNLKC